MIYWSFILGWFKNQFQWEKKAVFEKDQNNHHILKNALEGPDSKHP